MLRVILLGAVIALALFLLLKLTWKRLIEIPFRLKGKILRGATATVDHLQPCERPATAEASNPTTQWWQIELSVTPKAAPGSFATWEPGELRLAARDDKQSVDRFPLAELEVYMDAREGASLSEEGSAILHEGWHADQGWKLPGQRRLRFKFAAPASARQLCFQYYFESFGALELPNRNVSNISS